jgi:hypothetical protein
MACLRVVVQLYRTHISPADCELADNCVFFRHLFAYGLLQIQARILFGIRRNLTTILFIATCVIRLYDLILQADATSFTVGHISHALSAHVSSRSRQLRQNS